MKLIYLLRHAKSSWADRSLDDFDRPLNQRGVKAAAQIAQRIRKAEIKPAVVLCSPAVRTRQTLAPLLPWLADTPVDFDPRLYEASDATLFAHLARLSGPVPSALLIGHNPGLERLAATLASETSPATLISRLRDKFPTGGLAVFTAAIDDWSALRPRSCRLIEFVRPTDLADA
jgi:phosphohistidine phosphatase